MKVNVSVDDAGGGEGGKLWKECSGEEKVWAGCNKPGFVVPRVMCCDGVKELAVRVARNEV